MLKQKSIQIALVVIGLLLLSTLIALTFITNQANDSVAAEASPIATVLSAPTATAIPQPTLPPVVATPTTQPTQIIILPSPTPSPTVTETPTPTDTPTPADTATQTPLPTFTQTPVPPTWTPTPIITSTVASQTPLTETASLKPTVSLVVEGELDLSGFDPNTIFEPTATPTRVWPAQPISRTVKVLTTTPPISQVQSHFRFGRTFPDRGAWGSFNYPYGTNSKGYYLWHYGIDLAASYGKEIWAMGDGVVIFAGDDTKQAVGLWPDFYGKAVVVEHEPWLDFPVYTLYAHVSETLVEVGQEVGKGESVAKVGSGGVALGAHLHVEVRVGANSYSHTRNPDLWIQPDRGFGVVAGRVMDEQGYFVPIQHVTLRNLPDQAKYRRESYTYPDGEVNYDDQLQENFAFADVPPGQYNVQAYINGAYVTVPITVQDGALTFVLLTHSDAGGWILE